MCLDRPPGPLRGLKTGVTPSRPLFLFLRMRWRDFSPSRAHHLRRSAIMSLTDLRRLSRLVVTLCSSASLIWGTLEHLTIGTRCGPNFWFKKRHTNPVGGRNITPPDTVHRV